VAALINCDAEYFPYTGDRVVNYKTAFKKSLHGGPSFETVIETTAAVEIAAAEKETSLGSNFSFLR